MNSYLQGALNCLAQFFHWWASSPHFLLSLILITLLLIFLSLRPKYRKWHEGWLSTLVDNRLAHITTKRRKDFFVRLAGGITPLKHPRTLLAACRHSIFTCVQWSAGYGTKAFWSELRAIYFPNLASFGVFTITALCLVYFTSNTALLAKLSGFSNWTAAIPTANLSHDSFATVLAGLVAVIFALIVFVSESIRDSKHREHRRVLLSLSLLWPLALTSVLLLLALLLLSVTKLTLLLAAALGCATILSFARIIRTMLNPDLLHRSRAALLKARTREIINESARQRVATNILLSKVGDGKEIEFNYALSASFLERRDKDYIFLESPKKGRIADVNLTELAALFTYLDKQAEKLGFSIKKKTEGDIGKPTMGAVIRPTLEREPSANRPAYLLKRFGQWLQPTSIFSRDARLIFALPSEFGRKPSVIVEAEAALRHIFRFDSQEETAVSFRRELQATKDQLTSAIVSSSLGQMSDLTREYIQLAETFLEVMHEYGGGYSAKQADEERSNFFERWSEIDWLRDDLRELISVAATTESADAIGDVAYLPIAIAMRAVTVRDHLLFREFLSFVPFIYSVARNLKDGNTKRYMLDRSWRYLHELATYTIEPKLTNRDGTATTDSIESYKDFALHTLRVYQSLIYGAYSKQSEDAGVRDIASFNSFVEYLRRAYENFIKRPNHPNAAHIRFRIAHTQDEAIRVKLQSDLEIQEAIEAARSEITLGIDLVKWGVASRLFDLYRQQPDLRAELQPFMDSLGAQLPSNLPRLFEIFGASRRYDVYSYWGWNDWESIADGRVRGVDTHGKVDRLFVMLALKLLVPLDQAAIDQLALPASRMLAEAAEGPTSVLGIVAEVEGGAQNWAALLDANERSKAPALRQILGRVKEQQEANEAEEVRTSLLQPEKCDEFKAELLKSYNQSRTLRPIASESGFLRDLFGTIPPEGLLAFGFNQLDDKAAFIENHHVSYVGWGENYGEGMARGEDENVFLEISRQLQSQTTVRASEARDEIEDRLGQFLSRDVVILQTLAFDAEEAVFENNGKFFRVYNPEKPKTRFDRFRGLLGVYAIGDRNIPVFDVIAHDEAAQNLIVAVDLTKFGCWEQYDAFEDGNGWERIDHLSFRLIDLNANNERRAQLIGAGPQWLNEQPNPDAYLREKVIVEIYEKLRVVASDPSQGFAIRVEQSEDDSEYIVDAT